MKTMCKCECAMPAP